MRRILLAAAFVTSAVAAPGHAAACAAYAEPPQASGALVWAGGSLTCAAPDRLTLTVCVEALRPGALRWTEAVCGAAAGTAVTSLSASVAVCYQETALVRTTATGTSSTGTWYAASAPVLAPGVGSCGP